MSDTWVVGINPVEGVLSHDGGRVRELWLEQGNRNPRCAAIAQRAAELGLSVQTVRQEALARVADGVRHQGIAARYDAPQPHGEAELSSLVEHAGRAALLLILDGVTDPHNLGACLRSAAAAGADAVIVPRDRAAGLTPVVQRAAAGAADRVPLFVVTNLARTLRSLKQAGVWLVGLSGDAGKSLYQIDLSGPLGLVLGAEGGGLRRLTAETCDHVAGIPMQGEAESLNVSVATGIALFEALRQRRTAT